MTVTGIGSQIRCTFSHRSSPAGFQLMISYTNESQCHCASWPGCRVWPIHIDVLFSARKKEKKMGPMKEIFYVASKATWESNSKYSGRLLLKKAGLLLNSSRQLYWHITVFFCQVQFLCSFYAEIHSLQSLPDERPYPNLMGDSADSFHNFRG